MKEHVSFMKEPMDHFVAFMEASDRWCNNYDENLHLFDFFLSKNYPDATILTNDMVDGWCNKRSSENAQSRHTRIKAVISFIKYLNAREISGITPPEAPPHGKRNYIPHSFTEDEFHRFFYECDNIPISGGLMKNDSLRRSLIIPVFFRLLYSSGIRTTEARLLSRDDADLENGVLEIKRSKGYDQHYVALHDSMTIMLREYSLAMDAVMPERVAFFPNRQGFFLRTQWVSDTFKFLWNKANPGVKAVAYDIRHNYATMNINSWIDEGFSLNDNLVHLSRSMGHYSVDSTSYYYSLVPNLAGILEAQSGNAFKRTIGGGRL